MKIILYIMIMAAFISADLISINLKFMQLSLFRICVMLLSLITFFKYLKEEKRISIDIKSKQNGIIKYYFIWVVYAFLSFAWVQDHSSWMRAVFYIGIGFFTILLTSEYIKGENDFRRIFSLMTFMIIIHNIIGWSELLFCTYWFADLSKVDKYNQFSYNQFARVPVSMYGNQNDYATAMVIGVFIMYLTMVNSNKRVVKVMGYGSIISSIYLLIRADSRANMLGLIMGIIVFAFMKYFKKKTLKKILILIIILAIVFNPIVVAKIFSIASEKIYFTFGQDGSDRVRLNLIYNGFLFIKRTVGFGVGAGNIEYWMENYGAYYTGGITNMHNWWMEILTGYGVIIFLGYLFMYYTIFKLLYKSYEISNDRFIKNTSLNLILIMVTFILSSISSSSNMASAWIWLLWGVIISYVGYVESVFIRSSNLVD